MSHDELQEYLKVQRFLIRRFIARGLGTASDWVDMYAADFRARWESKHA